MAPVTLHRQWDHRLILLGEQRRRCGKEPASTRTSADHAPCSPPSLFHSKNQQEPPLSLTGFCFLAVAQIHSVVFPRAIRRVIHLVVARAVAIDVHVITVTCNFVVIASYRGAESQVLYSRRMVGGFADYFRCASSHMCVVTIECTR